MGLDVSRDVLKIKGTIILETVDVNVSVREILKAVGIELVLVWFEREDRISW